MCHLGFIHLLLQFVDRLGLQRCLRFQLSEHLVLDLELVLAIGDQLCHSFLLPFQLLGLRPQLSQIPLVLRNPNLEVHLCALCLMLLRLKSTQLALLLRPLLLELSNTLLHPVDLIVKLLKLLILGLRLLLGLPCTLFCRLCSFFGDTVLGLQMLVFLLDFGRGRLGSPCTHIGTTDGRSHAFTALVSTGPALSAFQLVKLSSETRPGVLELVIGLLALIVLFLGLLGLRLRYDESSIEVLALLHVAFEVHCHELVQSFEALGLPPEKTLRRHLLLIGRLICA